MDVCASSSFMWRGPTFARADATSRRSKYFSNGLLSWNFFCSRILRIVRACTDIFAATMNQMCGSQQNGAEMDYCRVVGPRGLCRPLDEKQGFPTNTSPLAPCQGCSKAEQSRATFREEAGGRAGRESAEEFGRDRPIRPSQKVASLCNLQTPLCRCLAGRKQTRSQKRGCLGGNWQGRALGPAQKAPSWNLPARGPRPLWGCPPDPPAQTKNTSGLGSSKMD